MRKAVTKHRVVSYQPNQVITTQPVSQRLSESSALIALDDTDNQQANSQTLNLDCRNWSCFCCFTNKTNAKISHQQIVIHE